MDVLFCFRALYLGPTLSLQKVWLADLGSGVLYVAALAP